MGTAAVSPDHRWLAYATDTAGDERYELRFRSLDAEEPSDGAAEVVADTGYGLAWSGESDVVFYVRLDEAQRPYQLWRHRLGSDPAEDTLVFEEADRRFSLGTGRTRDAASSWSACTAPTRPSGWPSPADPSPSRAAVMPRREGIEYAVDHLWAEGRVVRRR